VFGPGVSRTSTVGLFLLLGVLWGASFVSIEVGLAFFPPVLFAALRFYVAGVAILAYAAVTTPRWRPRRRPEWLVVAIVGGFMIAGHHALLYVGVPYITGAIAAVVVSFSPVLTAVFAAVLLDNRLTPVGLVGFGFGLAGIVLISRPDPSNLLTASAIGVGIVFLAVIMWALGAVLTRPYRTDLPVQTLQAWAMLAGAPALHAVALARGESLAAVEWTGAAVWSLGYLGLGAGALAFLIYFELLDRVGPAEINLIGYLEPVAATGVSFLVLGRLIDAPTAAGFCAIFLGFVLIKRRSLREALAPG
jgi:drug/metabolite transporter (DMT)-like permease